MKIPSRQSLLIIAVVVALAVNVIWRISTAEPKDVPPDTSSPAALLAVANQITPSLSGLSAMGREWERHITELPPEARAASKARLDAEKKFFMQAAMLPAQERKQAMRERLEALMNDPEVQGIMMEERMNRFARLDSATRQKLLKGYVQYKSQVVGQ